MNQEFEETQQNISSKEEDKNKFELLKQQFRSQFKESCKYVGFHLLLSFGKYLLCLYSLYQRDQQCDVNPLFYWLTIIGMYEFFDSIRYLAVLYLLYVNSKNIFLMAVAQILSDDSSEQINLQDMEEKNKRNQIKSLIKVKLSAIDIKQEELITQLPFSHYEITNQAEALNKYTRLMKVYNQFIFYLIFTGRNIAYFQSDSYDCEDSLNIVTFILLLKGYLFLLWFVIGFGLTILSMAIYIPIMLFSLIFNSTQILVKIFRTKMNIKRMKKFEYKSTPEFSQIQQCNICMCDYVDNDLVVQLPCIKHHFHDDCLRKWVPIKQQCPVCRKLF